VLGWIVNVVVSFVEAFVAAPIGGMVIAIMLSDGSRSLAATGGPRFSVALAGGMLVTLLGAWGALWIVNRWRMSSFSGERAADCPFDTIGLLHFRLDDGRLWH
jgi:hypothetical protein